MLDIVIVGDVNLCDIDYLSYAVRAALTSCIVPEVKINYNSLSNEYNVEVLDETTSLFKPEQIPHLFCFGVAGRVFLFDMNFEEYKSCDTSFLGVTNSKSEILQFEKIDGHGIGINLLTGAIDTARRNARSLYQELKL